MLTDERLAPVFALAAERSVPILIHGGRGLPPIADDLARLVERYPEAQLIVAHAGIADMAGLARPPRREGRRLLRHLGLEPARPARPLPPRRARAGASTPRTTRTGAAGVAAARRCARRGSPGFAEEQLRGLFGGNARRIAPASRRSSRRGRVGSDSFAQPLTFARIHQYLSMATPMLWTRQPDTIGVLGLALNAMRGAQRAPHRDGADPRAAARRARSLARAPRASTTTADVIQTGRAAFRLIHVADILAVTAGT